MSSARRAFHISDVLALLTEDTVSMRGSAGVCALAEHLYGGPLTVSAVDTLRPIMSKIVLQQYPELRPFVGERVTPSELLPDWLARRSAEFGEYLPITRANWDT